VHHSATETPPSSAEVKTVLVSEFARRFRLDQIEENRLRKLLGPVAKEIDLLRNAGRWARITIGLLRSGQDAHAHTHAVVIVV